MKARWKKVGAHRLARGDCFELFGELKRRSVQAVITSPPYAMQRAELYGGIPERDYPAWTVRLFRELRPALADNGSVLFNIRENIRGGQISDYVHRTRLALRDDGWTECEELIWIKPDGPPLGSPKRPRRSWERILWFAKTGSPFCNPRGNGKPSERIGLTGTKKPWINQISEPRRGFARGTDVATFCVDRERIDHPAKFPVDLAAWCVRLVTPKGATVVDPFMGSGTTGVACAQLGRRFVGFELVPRYFNGARRRIEAVA